jgi:hypothetical protein
MTPERVLPPQHTGTQHALDVIVGRLDTSTFANNHNAGYNANTLTQNVAAF